MNRFIPTILLRVLICVTLIAAIPVTDAVADTYGKLINGTGTLRGSLTNPAIGLTGWDLRASFDNSGPDFKGPTELTSKGTVENGYDYSSSTWQIRNTGGILYNGTVTTIYPENFAINSMTSKYTGTGVIELTESDTNDFTNLKLIFTGEALDTGVENEYYITFTAILSDESTGTISPPDTDPPIIDIDPEDDDSSGGCFLSIIK